MAKTKVALYHRESKKLRLAPVGFSWTTLFFGLCPQLFRSPRAWLLTLAMTIVVPLTTGAGNIVFAVFANQLYIKTLIRKGFRLRNIPPDQLEEVLSKIGISRARL